MKTVVIFYIPLRINQEEKDFLDTQVYKMRERHEGFEIFFVEDPARTKCETEVFFPYDKTI
jgi:hypothetical protein